MVFAWEHLIGRNAHDAGRQLLSGLYKQETGQLLPEILLAEQGKPYFDDGCYHFSISHTKSHVFCALSRQNIGIDAEETDRDIDLRLSEKILSPREKAKFDTAPDKRAAILRLWVLKEAYAKLLGKGWGNYLHATNFDPDDPRVQTIDGCYVAILEETEEENHAL